MVEIYLKNTGLDPKGARLEVHLKEEDLAFREKFLREVGVGGEDLLIGLNPGAGVYSRRWPKERFAKLGDYLSREYGAKLIIFGGKGEGELIEEVIGLMEVFPIDASKTSLRQLTSLIQRCNLFVTNDTGPMHIAVAMEAPVVTIFGSVSAKTDLPYGNGHIALQADLPCIPCGRSYCKELNCLKSITVEEVLASCRKILEKEI